MKILRGGLANIGSKRLNFLKKKEYYEQKQLKKYKNVVYKEEPDSEPELEEEDYAAEEAEEEPEIKKTKKNQEKRKNDIFDYISDDAKRHI